MKDMQLCKVDLTSQPDFSTLIQILSPHAPFSLHILGGILNARPRTGKLQSGEYPNTSAWTSKPLGSIDAASDLYCALIYSALTHQFHLFCSAESSVGPATRTAEIHVQDTIEAVLDLARVHAPAYDSELILGGDTGSPAVRRESDPAMVIIAAVHEKWHACLRSRSAAQYATARYVLPPGSCNTSTVGLPGELVVSAIQESDIERVRGTSHIPRPEEYYLTRSGCSVCLRPKGGAGKAIAWALVHADGGIGALYVDARYRRKGLAQTVIKELVKKLNFSNDPGMDGSSLAVGDDDTGGGALGWHWMDVDVGNEGATAFYDSFEGCRRGWICHWTYIGVW
ncbi:hypothetical protein BJ138DRAFT_1157070 [Hygrophoropsis aurantiaca]|uniref:Uncharacterized protein n=1 Tax=Hygrophoropsis aurantiaca TaxID=72124 RepID=A0ACB8A7L7_9AGAM|nr:hypothetical protein BJ138DRAFT_1157070 [Hygrophoropsis aurantiaca]